MAQNGFCSLIGFIGSAWRSERGTAAIEMALVAPVLVILLLGVSGIADRAADASKMQMAVSAGIQYAAVGGTDMTAAATIGNQAWTDKPAGSSYSATMQCRCGGVAATCGVICGDGNYPEIFVTVVASGTIGAGTYSSTKTITETVQLR